jgi:hypothetical protein
MRRIFLIESVLFTLKEPNDKSNNCHYGNDDNDTNPNACFKNISQEFTPAKQLRK